MRCTSMLMIGGASFPCDWPTDEHGRHKGWAHTNKNVQAIWGKDKSATKTLYANVVPVEPEDEGHTWTDQHGKTSRIVAEDVVVRDWRLAKDRPLARGATSAHSAEESWVPEDESRFAKEMSEALAKDMKRIDERDAKIESLEQDVEHLLRQGEERSRHLDDVVAELSETRDALARMTSQSTERGVEIRQVRRSKEHAISELTDAICRTVEYVGTDTLHPGQGWSWFDALKKYRPAYLEILVDESGKGRIPLGATPAEPLITTSPSCTWEQAVEVGRNNRSNYALAQNLYGVWKQNVIVGSDSLPRLRWFDIPLDQRAAWLHIAANAELLVDHKRQGGKLEPFGPPHGSAGDAKAAPDELVDDPEPDHVEEATTKPWEITLPGEGWIVYVDGLKKRVHYQDADD